MYGTVLGTLAFLGSLLPLLDLLRYGRPLPRFAALSPPSAGRGLLLPRLSVVVPARDEEAGVRPAVESMFRQDYPDLELVLVDDRSTDRTGRILAELAAEHPERAQLITVDRLPSGWLGKTHALWVGAQQASGAWLLFADADVVFEPSCFRRAVAHAEAVGLDHLTLGPTFAARGFWLRAFVACFGVALFTSLRLYLANDPRQRVGFGFGAFNLLRRGAYEAIGTHAALALRPDDDVQLGRRVKRLGLRQQLLNGADLLRVEWYPSLGAAIHGLEKNFFAGFDYSVPRVVGQVGVGLAVLLWTYVGAWWAARGARWLQLGTVAVQAAHYLYAYRCLYGQIDRNALATCSALPISALLIYYAAARSAWLALRRGGIRWRDTFYPLAQLRAQPGSG